MSLVSLSCISPLGLCVHSCTKILKRISSLVWLCKVSRALWFLPESESLIGFTVNELAMALPPSPSMTASKNDDESVTFLMAGQDTLVCQLWKFSVFARN